MLRVGSWDNILDLPQLLIDFRICDTGNRDSS